MRRLFAIVLSLLLLCTAIPAFADTQTFLMAGCDTYYYTRNWSTNAFFSRMEERTGVGFTFNQFGDLTRFSEWKAGLTKNSADLPDVLFKACLSDAEIRTLYGRGVLIDLRPWLNEETMPNLTALFADHPEWKAACTMPDGAIVTLPSIDPLQTNNLMWINTSWLVRVSKAEPTNAEELTDVLRAFRDQDANGNGNKDDERPLTFSSMWSLRFLLHVYGIIMNDYQLVTDEQGNVTIPLTTPQMREALQWLHVLYEENLIDHTGFSTPETLRKITDEKNIPYGMILGGAVTDLLPNTQMANYTALLPLTHNGKQVYRSFLGQMTRGTFAVTCRCSDPAAVLRWVDYLYSEEGCFLARAGKEGDDYRIESDGTWRWLVAEDQIETQIYARNTIAEDLQIPGYIPEEFQLRYANDTLRSQVEKIITVANIATEPCPQVFFTEEEAERLSKIWPELGSYIEYQLTWFVTGEESMDDAGWNAFCAKLTELGMDEVIAIWQGAVDRFEEACK
ncbi:MAG: hypothetical protein IK127_07675 [Clostridia bacterium]|nr:hypothetical protein [Clostridia bacterium]